MMFLCDSHFHIVCANLGCVDSEIYVVTWLENYVLYYSFNSNLLQIFYEVVDW